MADMRTAISGSTGLIGTALVTALKDRGDEVVPLVREEAQAGERRWWPKEGRIDGPGLEDVDAVINLSGAPIAGKPWTESRRRLIRDSRVDCTKTIAAAVDASERCTIFLSGSAVGYYGTTGDVVITESDPVGENFLASVCQDWEAAAANDSARTAFLRTGLVLDADGGLLAPQVPAFKLGLGGPSGNGKQWMPWISLADEVRAIVHVLDHDISGPVNLTGPNPVRNKEFAKALGAALNRPAFIPLPLPALRIALTSDAVDELILVSNRVLPEVLLESGFSFTDTQVRPTLKSLLDDDA